MESNNQHSQQRHPGIKHKTMLEIREATSRDHEQIRQLHLNAFPESESPEVAAFAANLLNEDTTPSTVNLVAESNGQRIGHVGLSPVNVSADPDWQGYILAPVGILPEFQKQKVGSRLIEHGKQRLTENGVHVLFVYGDPGYYSRFGFTSEAASVFVPPYELEFPHGWQAAVLNGTCAEGFEEELSCVASLQKPSLW